MEEERATGEREYVLGTSDEELVRLGFQHQVWSAQAASAWERAGFVPGSHLLDVACGPGYATLDMARLVGGEGHVTGVDMSEKYLSFLRAQAVARGVSNVSAVAGDVEELNFDEAAFDGAFARWVLCFVRRPEAVISGVARALKPGAAFVVHDYVNYERGFVVAPRAPIFDRVIQVVGESYRARGGNPDIGTELPRIMNDCGLEVKEINSLVRIARPRTALWRWPETFFQIYLPTLVGPGLLTEDERLAFEATWRERSNDPSAFFSSPPVLEVIGVKK